jgi:hypothetical protein
MRHQVVLGLLWGFALAVSVETLHQNASTDLQKRQGKNGGKTASGYKMVRADQATSLKEKTWNPPANLKNALDVTWECKTHSF